MPLPPSPTRAPWSQLGDFRRDPLGTLTGLHRECGDVAMLRLLNRRLVLLSHPDYIRDVLITHNRLFIKSLALQRSRRLLGDGLLTSEGDLHLRQRRLIQPAFHRREVRKYADSMVSHALRTRDRWQDGATVDIWQEMTRLTLGVAAQTLFSTEVESEAEAIRNAIGDAMDMFRLMTLPFFALVEYMPLPSVRRFERARKRLDSTIYRMIDERRASGEHRDDLLSMLLEAQDEEAGGGMTDAQVRDEAITLFIAGHETTANALTWTWYLLAQHPDVMERLQREVGDVLGERAATADDFERLRYTRMVLGESMRLYPPAWSIGREALTDYEVGEYMVPKGAVVLVSQWVTHRDPRFFDDPERFDPDRWTEEAEATRPKFSYFPFGAGSRICVGEGFAWMEGVLVLATLAQRWRLRLVPGQHVEPRPLITLRPRTGIQMALERR